MLKERESERELDKENLNCLNISIKRIHAKKTTMTFVRQAQYCNWQVKKTGVSIYILPHLHEDLQTN